MKNDPLESRNVFNNPEYKEVISKLVAEMDSRKEELQDTDKPFPELVKRRKESGL